MAVQFNPFTGNLDIVGAGASANPGGSDTQVQFNDGGAFGGSADLTWDDTGKLLTVGGDIDLDDGGTYATTLQVITPTADRTISYPDATGTLALVAGSSGQLIYNNAGANAGLSTAAIGATGDITLSLNGAASTPPLKLTGTWFSGANSKPHVLIEPTGTTSTTWSTSGTGLGVNAASGFTGNLLDLQSNGTTKARITHAGIIEATPQAYNFAAFKFFGFNSGITHWTQGHVGIIRQSTHGLLFTGTDHIIGGSQTFAWSSGSPGLTTTDTYLYRDAAGILAQRNGANAQTYRLYNTYTDASNYERAKLAWNSNVFEIGTEGAGTGSEQPVRITAAALKLPNLPTYADNAAATSGGLVAGDVYKTATGELRITV